MLAYIDKIPYALQSAFTQKMLNISNKLGLKNPSALMHVMYLESNLRPWAENRTFPFYKNGQLQGYATGLIQITPDTAASLGTTTWALANMGYLDQLDYVYKYLKPYTGRLHNVEDVYAAVFFPLAIGKKGKYVFESKYLSRSAIARSNPGIDLNKDGQINWTEFKQYIRKKADDEYLRYIYPNSAKNKIILIGSLAIILYSIKKLRELPN